MRAEAAGDPGPWRRQAILGRGRWDADALRDIVRDYVVEHLADDDAVLVVDETGFLKQGKASCDFGRQYASSGGKITNCQIGVFAAYVSRHGHAFIDIDIDIERALYLPRCGQAIRPGWLPRMCRRMPVLFPSRHWRWR
jgi:SRSO17 transposase